MKKLLTLLGAMAIAGTTQGDIITLFQDASDVTTYSWQLDQDEGITTAEVTTVDGNDVLHMEDSSSAGNTQLRAYDVVDTYYGMVRFSYDVTVLAFAGTSSDAFKARLGEYDEADGTNPTSSSYAGVSVEPRADGDFQVKSTSTVKLGAGTLSLNDTYHVDVIANFGSTADTQTLDGTSYTLDAQSQSVYLSINGAAATTVADNIALYYNGVGTSTRGFDSVTFSMDTSKMGGEYYIDNVVIETVTAVPEPSTYAALAGLLALGFAAYRRRRA